MKLYNRHGPQEWPWETKFTKNENQSVQPINIISRGLSHVITITNYKTGNISREISMYEADYFALSPLKKQVSTNPHTRLSVQT